MRKRIGIAVLGVVAAVSVALAGCGSSGPGSAGSAGTAGTAGSSGSGGSSGHTITVVAAENFWGSLATQLGGAKVNVHSIIDNPAADPHDYEATAADARAVATADVVIVNGVGYDGWASKLVAANGSSKQKVLTVGDIVHQPADGNPHRWYSPSDVQTVMSRITATYASLDSADASYFTQQATTVRTKNLGAYFSELASIKKKYAGTPIGASESIVSPLADYLGLKMMTPYSFLRAISEGTDPTAADKSTIDAQIAQKQIKVYVYNSQNATPDVQQQVKAAKAQGIPVTTVTETLTPAGASFQQWQTTQLTALAAALHRATGK